MRTIITGASKGIGKAIAFELAPASDALVLVARSEDLLADVREAVMEVNADCVVDVQVMDATNEDDVVALFEHVDRQYGGVDALVNCAGLAIPARTVQEISLETWNQIFSVNMTSAFLMTKEAIPALTRSDRGAIVNIASTAGISPRPGWSAYAAAKAALVNFSQTMAEELKPSDIQVHCVAPGRTATELRRVLAPEEDPSTIMQPESVAGIVAFLLSPEADVIRGQTILVRGQ